MPKPLAAHFRAQARAWASGSAATFLEQFTSTTETSLYVSAAKDGSANRPTSRESKGSLRMRILSWVAASVLGASHGNHRDSGELASKAGRIRRSLTA